jgi:hypothetical protein
MEFAFNAKKIKIHCQNVAKFGPCMGPGVFFFFFSIFVL